MPFGKRKKYFRRSYQFSIVTILEKHHPSRNMKLNNLGNFGSLKLRILMGKKTSNFSNERLNFTQNIFPGCYGLKCPDAIKKILFNARLI